MIINIDNVEKAKRLIKDAKEKPVFVVSQNDFFNRKILEYGKFDFLLNIERGEARKNTLKHIDSGLNHVIARIAKKNNVALALNLEEIRKLDKKEKALLLSRIIQNIRISRKFEVKLNFLNFKDKKNAFSFVSSLGASTKQADESIRDL